MSRQFCQYRLPLLLADTGACRGSSASIGYLCCWRAQRHFEAVLPASVTSAAGGHSGMSRQFRQHRLPLLLAGTAACRGSSASIGYLCCWRAQRHIEAVVVVVVVVVGQTVGSISSKTLAYDCLCTLELCTASMIATS